MGYALEAKTLERLTIESLSKFIASIIPLSPLNS